MTCVQEYIQALKRSGKYDCRIWPYHCLVGSPGASVVDNLLATFEAWSARHEKPVQYVTKGRNIRTEMYSVRQADCTVAAGAASAAPVVSPTPRQRRADRIANASSAEPSGTSISLQAVKAEVVDPNDASTALNLDLIDRLQMRQGAIVFAGEAASHCVNYTVRLPRSVAVHASVTMME